MLGVVNVTASRGGKLLLVWAWRGLPPAAGRPGPVDLSVRCMFVGKFIRVFCTEFAVANNIGTYRLFAEILSFCHKGVGYGYCFPHFARNAIPSHFSLCASTFELDSFPHLHPAEFVCSAQFIDVLRPRMSRLASFPVFC